MNSRKGVIEAGEHGTMDLIADLTGGKNTHNTNGMTEAVAAAMEAGSNFYTLTYAPANQALDTRFRTITVKTTRPDLKLTYRNGYYADDPEVDAKGHKIETVPPMQAALMRGSLNATQIAFRVTASPLAATSATLPANNTPETQGKLNPPYRVVTLSYLIDVHAIDFTPGPDGNLRGAFDYGVRVYNADGDEVVNSASKEVHPILPQAVYQSMLQGGANARLDIALPATGDYFLRVAVHDLNSGRVGSLEIACPGSLEKIGPEH